MLAQRDTIVLLFGSQTLDSDPKFFIELRETLLSDVSCQWILDVIRQLPEHWSQVMESFPELEAVPGAQLLESLENWIRTGSFHDLPKPLPSILLTPLVVVGHLVQCIQFIGVQPSNDVLIKGRNAETLGLCIGLLSAFAVASSVDQLQLRRYGAVAIRLAMFLGAVVDAQSSNAGHGEEAVSISAAWSSTEVESSVRAVVEQFQEAYISVLFDDKRATITTTKNNSPALIEQLREVDAVAMEISLRGRFHCACHIENLERYLSFCNANDAFQMPDASELIIPTRSNADGDYLRQGKLHDIAIRSILVYTSNWHRTFSAALSSALAGSRSRFVQFGTERCVPPSLVHRLGSRLEHFTGFYTPNQRLEVPNQLQSCGPQDSNDRIAVIGMSCHVPGANSLDEFWSLLCDGKSQHVPVPPERFTFETAWREIDPHRTWYGNFMKDHDAFDHKFFKKSPREMASTDPQHRIMQQVAYQAVEQSGYFNTHVQNSKGGGPRIGCYVGVGLVDYENNIACYPATAYSATGNLRSFAAGKISHYFGWTGPSLTIDTACSSSAVAVHHACQSILSGECTSALAGGVNIMTSPQWFQNLAGASFLSTTGPCKPFDVKADGYCRGEGSAAVFLKKYSDAVADGNQILGVVAATSVYQNRNCTAITVPDSSSLSEMFRDVTDRAGLHPSQISFVEAHGTGTPVGDPAEYDGVRRVFGGPVRSNTLSLGSVKGLVGHTESASGIVSLVKALLMIHHGFIPPQASFDTIAPAIKASVEDKIQIDKTLRRWDVDYRAVLINNYGASGSNASMVVTQCPHAEDNSFSGSVLASLSSAKHPFWLTGFDDRSLSEYCDILLRFVKSKMRHSQTKDLSLANLAFQVSRQSNRSLARSLIFEAESIEQLEQTLANGASSAISTPQRRPVILCFGGQVSTFVGLDKQVYEGATIFRRYLDDCDRMCRLTRVLDGGIYPEIFQKEPLDDIVKLQTALFANQYACAKTWIDCGISVDAVCGHSFGELTALCVSGIVSLADALRMITARAKLIKESWGDDKGSMMAIEADLDLVRKLLAEANGSGANEPEFPASIACYNGPRSFTLAGSTKSIGKVTEALKANPKYSISTKFKRLNVTNAFHSTLVEPLMPRLIEIGNGVSFTEPDIPFEQATEFSSSDRLRADYLGNHLRNPVYFNNAVQRLSQKYPNSVWLEAGSNSTITIMASRALASPKNFHFQPVNITAQNGLRNISNATVALWNEGLNVSFWPHHNAQTREYVPLLLPPYQFEKSKHWMALKEIPKTLSKGPIESSLGPEIPKGLWTFVGYKDATDCSAKFIINTKGEEFKRYVSGHKIAQTIAMCPSILQISIVVDAITSLYPGFRESKLQPQLENMISHAPMTISLSKAAWLEAEVMDMRRTTWKWKILSENFNDKKSSDTLHISGHLTLRSLSDPVFQNEFSRYERLVGAGRPGQLLDNNTEVDEVIQGRSIYRSFNEIVEYNEEYRGVQKIVGMGLESAGRVSLPYDPQQWLNTGLSDSFCQVAGIFVNCMTDRSDKEIYISDQIERWIRSPRLTLDATRPNVWDVYACHSRSSHKEFLSDIFVFDHRNGTLAEAILGVRYQRVSKHSLIKVLSGLSSAPTIQAQNYSNGNGAVEISNSVVNVENAEIPESSQVVPVSRKNNSSSSDVVVKVKEIVCNLSGLEQGDIKEESELIELGIDSLMGMELAREIETLFNISLETASLLEITDFRGLVRCIQNAIGVNDNPEPHVSETVQTDQHIVNGQSRNSHTQNLPEFNEHQQILHTNGSDAIGGSNGTKGTDGIHLQSENHHTEISMEAVVNSFGETKRNTDNFIVESGLGDYVESVLPLSDELCVVHILDAFEQLGCSIRNALPGDILPPIEYLPRHNQYVACLYDILRDAGLVQINNNQVIRTSETAPSRSAQDILQELVHNSPAHESDHRLTSLAGFNIADCLVGKADGVQLIFSSKEGRSLASNMYGKSPINTAWIEQMVSFIKHVVPKMSAGGSPVKILELGAGTGGTTAKMASLFASMNIPVEYTVTDISSSLVAGARKRFKQYSFMKFRVHDIEKPPTEDMLRSQHLVIATNCIHATHNLKDSTKNIHDILQPTGFLLMLEMTKPLAWIDLIFGLLEGWWLFNDGRCHALTDASYWENTLHSVGYRQVDWTAGRRPEANIQRLIIALPSADSRYVGKQHSQHTRCADTTVRKDTIESYIREYTQGFVVSSESQEPVLKLSHDWHNSSLEPRIVLTGATGSLGCQILAYLVRLPNMRKVVCLNRPRSVGGLERQRIALESRGIFLDATALSKIEVFETDTSKPMLGLDTLDYNKLVTDATHIVHNAWPMSITRPVQAFESQFRAMRNLIHLARDIALWRRLHSKPQRKVVFQFISSIATVGYYPLWTGRTHVPEEPMIVDSVLPSGYGDAKLVCEKILEKTLNSHSSLFRAMTVRIGQIAGSTSSGYWNPVEHLAFLIKSCQTIKALPALDGDLSWCPATDVAATLGDLILGENADYSIYHIENPSRQPWSNMLQVLSQNLGVPSDRIIPFNEWIRRVKEYPGSVEMDNPASMIVDFLEAHFVRMSCGGLVLNTDHTRRHSDTLARQNAISSNLVQEYIRSWREMGFLK